MYPMHERERDSMMRGERLSGHGVDAPSPTTSSCSSTGVAGGPGGGVGLHIGASASVSVHSPLSPYSHSDVSYSEHTHLSSPPCASVPATPGMHSSDTHANPYILSPQAQTPSQIQALTASSARSLETAAARDRSSSFAGEPSQREDQGQNASQRQQRLTKASHFAALFPPPRATASFTTTVSSLPTPAHSPRSVNSQSFAASHPHSSYNSHHYHPYSRVQSHNAQTNGGGHPSPHSTATSTETGSGSASLSASPLSLLPSLSHSSTTSVSASRPGSISDFCLTSPVADVVAAGGPHHLQHQLSEAGVRDRASSFSFDPQLGNTELPLWPGQHPAPKQISFPHFAETNGLASHAYCSRARAASANDAIPAHNGHHHLRPSADAFEGYTFDDADAEAEAELDFVDQSSASPELSRGSRAHSHQHLFQPGTPRSPFTPYSPYIPNLPPNHSVATAINSGGGGGGPSGTGGGDSGYYNLLTIAQQNRHSSSSSTSRTLLEPFNADSRANQDLPYQHPTPSHPYINNTYPHHLYPQQLQGAHLGMYNDTDFDGYESDDILSGSNVPPSGSFPSRQDASGASGAGKKDDKQVRRRSSKACDQCRKSKCKCERTKPSEPCKNCIMLGTPCTFLGPSRKRGPPKGYIDAIESRLHQTEAVIGILLALASPEPGEDSAKPDERARTLLDDLRNNDALAREIVDRVDRGAYGTKGRRAGQQAGSSSSATGQPNSAGGNGSSGDERSGSGETAKGRGTSEKGADGSKVATAGPPPSIQGRGRMVGLGQEIEMGGLFNTHPSNEWQDNVMERLKAAVRERTSSSTGHGNRPSLSILPPGSSNDLSGPMSVGDADGPDERDRRRRRVDSIASSAHPMRDGHSHSPERMRRAHRSSVSMSVASEMFSPIVGTSVSAAHYSPPVAPQPSYASASGTTAAAIAAAAAAAGLPQSTPSDGFTGQPTPDLGLEGSEEGEDEEGITDAVGQLSLNEDAQVRFHGKASGLHLLGQKPRVDGRNRGGIWHFPKARVWPPVAPSTSMRLMRSLQEAEEIERAARARLPSREVQEHLLEIYFAHVHPYLPVVHKESFYEDFKAMHEEDAELRSSDNTRLSADRGRSPIVVQKHPVSDERSSSPSHSAATPASVAPADHSIADSGAPRSSAPRLPALLLFSMFAIAARYAPIAHGTSIGNSASPPSMEAIHAASSSLSASVLFDPPVENGRTPSANGGADSESAEVASSASRADQVEAEALGAEDAGDVEAEVAQPPPTSGHMWAAGDGFLDRAKAILDKTYASSRPSTCQALLLMGYREIGIGAMAQSWLYVGMAVRMAQDLGMHRQSDRWHRVDGPIFTPVEQQIRKRIWYACVVMDKYVSTYIGRPLSIFESDYDTQLPGVDETEELELWIPHESQPNSVAWDPVEAGGASLHEYKPVSSRLLSCFNESARLSSILAMIVQAIYTVKPVTSKHLEAMHLEQTLDRWYLELPEHLRYETHVRDAAVPPPHVLTLHMQYWCAVLLLHRPFIRHYISLRQKQAASPGSPIEPDVYSAAQKNFDLCVSAANHITSIVSVYQEHFCIKRCSVFLSYYIFSAGIMHMTSMATNPSDPQASLGLTKCMEVLKRMELVWPSAGRAWELLDGAKDDLDYSASFSSVVRPKKRTADESFDITDLEEAASQLERATSHRMPLDFGTPSTSNGQTYGSATIDIDSPLGYFSSYDRWSSDNALGFPMGLSTSVLPQQYSTGFLDERLLHGMHRTTGALDPNGRYPHVWSDYSLGQTSSMLGSMYGMPLMHQGAQVIAAQHHPQNLQHPQQHNQPPSGVYLTEHYDIFNSAPQP